MRIYTSANDPYDFCVGCRPTEDEAEEKYGAMGDGPDGRGNCFAYDAEHPPYQDFDCYYQCDECGEWLTDED
jgi:hypothetical protein